MRSGIAPRALKALGLAASLALVGLFAGCAGRGTGLAVAAGDYVTPVKPPPGFIFASTRAPLTYEFSGNPTGANVTKEASAETQYIQLFYRVLSVGFDDIDVESIAKDGGIQEISYADYEYFNVLGIYKRITVNVYGN